MPSYCRLRRHEYAGSDALQTLIHGALADRNTRGIISHTPEGPCERLSVGERLMDCHDLHSRRWLAVNRNHIEEPGGRRGAREKRRAYIKEPRAPALNHIGGLQEINKVPPLANNGLGSRDLLSCFPCNGSARSLHNWLTCPTASGEESGKRT